MQEFLYITYSSLQPVIPGKDPESITQHPKDIGGNSGQLNGAESTQNY